MHLWPSLKIRDSFKKAYLTKLEWNLNRMNSEKSSHNNQNLLEGENGERNQQGSSSTSKSNCFWVFCREILMLVSCCYCCFCCGACVDQLEEEEH